MKEFNPHWPFPQYDEDGNRLMPPGWNIKPTAAQLEQEMIDEIGEALL